MSGGPRTDAPKRPRAVARDLSELIELLVQRSATAPSPTRALARALGAAQGPQTVRPRHADDAVGSL